MPAPVLAGVTLPLPSGYGVTPVPVVDERELADGTLVRYHRGHRTRWALSWRSKRPDTLADIFQAAQVRGVTQFVDLDGVPHVVLVEDVDEASAIPGTVPVRWECGVTLVERRPR
jgi:hypothetical protein